MFATLLNLGIKNTRLGPSLSAYVTPNVLNVLVEEYNQIPTTMQRKCKEYHGR